MKTAIVIGGSGGYGKGVFEELKARHRAISLSLSTEPAMDATNEYNVRANFDKIPEIDIVVYCAGIAIGNKHVVDKDINDSRKVFEVNTIGLLNVLKASYKKLKESKGIFIYVGTIASEFTYEGGADYCASKTASTVIMKTIRKEWLGTGIRTCIIEPALYNKYYPILK